MDRRKLRTGCLALLAAPVVLLGAAVVVLLWMSRLHEISSETAERGEVTLRLVKSASEPMPGFIDFTYDLELRTGDGRGFRRIADATFDGDLPFGADRVVWVDDAHVVVPVLWRVLSSADGGRTWSEWDANDALLGGACCALPEAIEIDRSGHGSAYVPLRGGPEGGVRLETRDFGRSWREASGLARPETP